LAHEGQTVPELLRDINSRISLGKWNPLSIAKYMREAFGLSLLEVKPIGGWSLEGDGELSDHRLNELMMPAIVANREWWDQQIAQLID
jgi:hypothetical protein